MVTDFDQWALPKLGLIWLILRIMGYYRQVRLGGVKNDRHFKRRQGLVNILLMSADFY